MSEEILQTIAARFRRTLLRENLYRLSRATLNHVMLGACSSVLRNAARKLKVGNLTIVRVNGFQSCTDRPDVYTGFAYAPVVLLPIE